MIVFHSQIFIIVHSEVHIVADVEVIFGVKYNLQDLWNSYQSEDEKVFVMKSSAFIIFYDRVQDTTDSSDSTIEEQVQSCSQSY